MPLPTDAQINSAVPSNGTPNRAQTNAILKSLRDRGQVALYFVDQVPESSNSPGEMGMVAYDEAGEMIFFCVAPNRWLSAGLTEW